MNDKEKIAEILRNSKVDFKDVEEKIVLFGGTEGVSAREFCDRALYFNFEQDGSLKNVGLVG